MQLSEQIYEILKNSPQGLKARDIAKELGVDKKEINSKLYGQLRGKCYQDNLYVWHTNGVSKSPRVEKDMENSPDETLNSICKYYLSCLSLDDSSSVKTFASGKFGLNYIELDHTDYNNINFEDINHLKGKLRNGKNMTAYFGYPVLVEKVISRKNNQEYFFVVPVLQFRIEFLTDDGIPRIDPTPNINMDVIKKFSAMEKEAQIYELLKLENQLGLDNPDADVELDELVARLVSIQSHWEWKETINIENISTGDSLSELHEEGIYNRAIILLSERSPFTQGLEKELNQLSKLNEKDYKQTALYNWLHSANEVEKSNDEGQILEVLPLNSEQEQAIKMSLSENLTVVTGPPGTGKSQVVTNLLINAAWQKKSALFASKNNKAVDVVEKRVNEIGKRPILLRIGNNEYANRLSELFQNILSVRTTSEDILEYDRIKAEYDSINEKIKSLLMQKEKIIAVRNQTDKLEQIIERYRGDLANIWNAITEEDIEKHIDMINNFEKIFHRVQKSKQKPLMRLFWNLIKSSRIKEYELLTPKAKQSFRVLNLSTISLQYSDLSTEAIQNAVNLAKARIEGLIAMQEYRDILLILESNKKLEKIDMQTYKLKQKLSSIAFSLWDKWLTVQPISINQTDRQEMTGFIAALRLHSETIADEGTTYNAELNKKLEKVRLKMAKYFPCWAVTSLSANRRVPFEPGLFDLLIIDEASQCDIASVLPLLYRAKNAVIIGDPKQLSHITGITNKQDTNLLNKYSIPFNWSYKAIPLFDLANSLTKNNIVNLRDHHRSHANIIDFSNKEFYDGSLRIATRYDKLVLPTREKAGIRWIQVSGKTTRPPSGGAVNRLEAEELVKAIRHLVFENEYRGTIGAVTPFKAQAELIREMIFQHTKLAERLQTTNKFLVDTVHKFQGDERDIMFFSPVISDGISSGALGFLNSTGNLFNVAITRARAILVVVANRSFCSNCGVKYLEHFAAYSIDLENTISETVQTLNYAGEDYPEVPNMELVSDWEKQFYSALYKVGILTIPQYPVEKYHLDLALFDDDRRLDIEVDGEMYHRDWNGERCYRDQIRNHRLYELGWDVMRFWVYQIRDDLDWCINQIEEWKKQKV